MTLSAQEMIRRLDLQRHPEGGWYRQTWAGPEVDGRPNGTCIYFLLQAGERSHWHKVDATEIWLFHAGDPLLLKRSDTDEGPASAVILGPDLARDHVPQALVAAHAWQSAASLPTEALGPDRAGWSLVSCTVTPGFVFDGFHLADADFDIPFSPEMGPQQHPEDERGG